MKPVSLSEKALAAHVPSGATPPDPLELDASAEKATRIYLLVGLLLLCGTLATVAVASVPWLDVGEHGFDKWDALLGLGIATFKASLVAAVFMHLNHERRLIYVFMTIAAIHVTGLFIGTFWHFRDFVHDGFFFGSTRPHPNSQLGGQDTAPEP
jgi:caa(3)-type oxidase subunit IV